jgi:CRP/FNR family cyclic AMP-dependent transcriptional regulator
MFVQQVDLFKDLPQAILGEIAAIGEEIARPKGEFLFRAGEPADFLYVLQEGRARVTIGEKGHIHFLACDPGDIFGWPSLVDRPVYTASVECLENCKFLRIPKEKLGQILAGDTASQAFFYKRLCGIIGQRLISAYDAVLSAYREQGPPSYG